MTLLSITYGIFLLSVLGLYWLQESRSLRLGVLLAASLVFYASLQIQYVPLLLALTLITFVVGRSLTPVGNPPSYPVEPARNPDVALSVGPGVGPSLGPDISPGVRQSGGQTHKPASNLTSQMTEPDWNWRRFGLLWFGISLLVLVLVGFKYLPFLLAAVSPRPNLSASSPQIDLITTLIAPLGLSYFVFECIAYLVDVYRGAPAAGRLLPFLTYKLFFPKLLSGPITRYHAMDGQLAHRLPPKLDQVVDGLWLIAVGALKKLLLADHLATLVNLSFDNLERAGSGDIWLATAAYGLQLYLDFSGYVDVARGSAILLGIYLPENFRAPYFSSSIADFWRRWHITLGDWLRNYLYFPLGGSRRGLIRTCLNLVVVMVIAGIWHNPGWGFVVWGLIHGVALAAHRITDQVAKRSPAVAQFWSHPVGGLVGWGLTQATVFFSWIFFRLPDPQAYGLALSRLVGQAADIQFGPKIYLEGLQASRAQIVLMLLAIFLGMAIVHGFRRGLKLQFNWYLKVALSPLFIYLAWLLAPSERLPYIYFDF